jgi:hypothetical protein
MFRKFLPQNSTLTSDTRVSVSVVARMIFKYSQIFIRSTYIVISDFVSCRVRMPRLIRMYF